MNLADVPQRAPNLHASVVVLLKLRPLSTIGAIPSVLTTAGME
jgi:hypothetical protein